MQYAKSIEEVVRQLGDALAHFEQESTPDTWDNLEKKCMQLSQWIEHCITDTEKRPDLVKTLFAAEKILLDNRQYCRRKLHYK